MKLDRSLTSCCLVSWVAAGSASSVLEGNIQGECWTEALRFFEKQGRDYTNETNLQDPRSPPSKEDPCRWFSETDKKTMALIMTECHIGARSRKSTTCDVRAEPRKESVQKCFESFSDTEFHIYLNFYNHIESICFHVYSALWQTKTDQLINSLRYTADMVANQLDSSAKKHEELLEGQRKGIAQQENMLASSALLHQAIEGGQDRLQTAFDEIRTEVEDEHRRFQEIYRDLFHGFDRILNFQKFLKNRIFDLQTCLLYSFVLIVSHFMTTADRTSSSRGYLYLTWTCMALTEHMTTRLLPIVRTCWGWTAVPFKSGWAFMVLLIRCHVQKQRESCEAAMESSHEGLMMSMDDDAQILSSVIAGIRVVAMAIALAIWLYAFVTYQSPIEKSVQGLTEHITRLHSQLEQRLEPNPRTTQLCTRQEDNDPLEILLRKGPGTKRDRASGKYRTLLERDVVLAELVKAENPGELLARLQCNVLSSKLRSNVAE